MVGREMRLNHLLFEIVKATEALCLTPQPTQQRIIPAGACTAELNQPASTFVPSAEKFNL